MKNEQPKSEQSGKEQRESEFARVIGVTSVLGGATLLSYVVSLFRIKVVAVLLGPSGVGIVSLLQTTGSLVQAFTGLGIDSSGIREVAKANSCGDSDSVASVAITLQRLAWVTGLSGLCLCFALSQHISQTVFGTADNWLMIVGVGVVVLLLTLTGGYQAILRGKQRVRLVALINLCASIIGTLIGTVAYWKFGSIAIVPVMIIGAAGGFLMTYAAVLHYEPMPQDVPWATSVSMIRPFVTLGLSFMWGAFAGIGVTFLIRASISKEIGVESVGIYAAAWSLSGMLATFVLQAMGQDFYPSLTAVSDDNQEVNRRVNEQIEIACLLGVPGLLMTLAVSPWIVKLLYSSAFLEASVLMPFLVGGVFFQLIGYPVGFIQRAKAATGWLIFSQTEANLLLLTFSLILLETHGLQGIAIAMPSAYFFHCFVTIWIAKQLSGFSYKQSTIVTVSSSSLVIALAILTAVYCGTQLTAIVCGCLGFAAFGYSMIIIRNRLPLENRLRVSIDRALASFCLSR